MSELKPVFDRLRKILALHEDRLQVVKDTGEAYALNTLKPDENGRPVFFGSVKAGKKRVSFHLMPVYCRPELLDEISPLLRKRMQGKSCFNFARLDEALLSELTELVRQGVRSFEKDGRL